MHILYPDFHDDLPTKKYHDLRLHINYISLVTTLNLKKKNALAMGQNYDGAKLPQELHQAMSLSSFKNVLKSIILLDVSWDKVRFNHV